MEKKYDFSSMIDALRKDFNPYEVLGISRDTSDDVILRMWNRYRNRNMSAQIKKAFFMLIIPVNRWVYDRLVDYVSKNGKDAYQEAILDVNYELLGYIARMEDDILCSTKKDFEDTINFARHRLSLDDPSTGIKDLEHVARYTQNKEGFWFYSKDLKTGGASAIVDIYKRGDKYVYYIKEHNWEYVIESRYLFIDFNKPTRFDGRLCRLSDVACRIKGNILGLYTEMNNMDPNIYMKRYYFKNKLGNVYSDGLSRDDSELKVVDIKKRNVWVPGSFKSSKNEDIKVINCYLKDYKDYYMNGNNVSEYDEELILADAKNTNLDDVLELKKIIGRREI